MYKRICAVIKCDDGHELVSRHKHDYSEHTTDCGFYMLDGGPEETRLTVPADRLPTTRLIDTDSPHSEIRKYFLWRSSTGDVLLKDIETDHLLNILQHIYMHEDAYSEYVLKIMEDEMSYRL